MPYAVYIPESFEKAVVVHVLRICWLNQTDAPLMLGIHGYPGEGKTFQCKKVLERINLKVFQISGGQLESKNAGEPAQLIRDTYNQAQLYCEKGASHRAALLIDDADVAFGNWGELYQYTVNTQNLLAELMNLADYHKDNQVRVRIPIFLTGNDLRKLYAPLKRAGRMNFFHWEPDHDQRLKLLYFSFPNLCEEECNELLSYAANKLEGVGRVTTSFFTDLKASVYDDYIWSNFIQARNEVTFGDIIDHMAQPTQLPKITLENLKHCVDQKVEQLRKSNASYLPQ